MVTNRKHWSRLAAKICDCFDKLVDFLIIQFLRSSISVMSAVLSGCGMNSTRSPIATGLVERIPFRRKLPFTLQSIILPSSARTVYQLPVFLMTSPFNCQLNCHDFLILLLKHTVNLLDILIMKFLALFLCIFFYILRHSVLYALLEFLNCISTCVSYTYLC